MDVNKYLELGFKTPEEMILYIDFFGGNCIKEKEPTSLEELLRNLKDESSISFVPKTKQDYDEEISKEETSPKLAKMSLGHLLRGCSGLSEVDRLIAIWTYYTELGKVKEHLYDDAGMALIQDFLKKDDSINDDEINKLIEMRKLHIIGEYYPYKDLCNKAHQYLLTRANSLDKTSQDKFSSYIGDSISQKENNFRNILKRDKAFVELMSQGARMQDENIERRRQERYQSMIDELDEAQQPPFRRK